MSEQQKEDKIGALWSKSSGRGEFFTGNLELKPEQIKDLMDNDGKLSIVVFKNDRKTGNQPDWRILKARPKATEGQHAARVSHPSEPVTDDQIPF